MRKEREKEIAAFTEKIFRSSQTFLIFHSKDILGLKKSERKKGKNNTIQKNAYFQIFAMNIQRLFIKQLNGKNGKFPKTIIYFERVKNGK